MPEVVGMGGSSLLINGLLVPAPSIFLLAQEGLCVAISLAIFYRLPVPVSCCLKKNNTSNKMQAREDYGLIMKRPVTSQLWAASGPSQHVTAFSDLL